MGSRRPRVLRHRTVFFLLSALIQLMLAETMPAIGESAGGANGKVIREVVDPCLGRHWQWILDTRHPNWPAHLILIDGPEVPQRNDGNRGQLPSTASVVIRAGDSVMISQDSDVLSARLLGIALGKAVVGEPLRVRLVVPSDWREGANSLLTSQGRMITVIADGKGSAKWLGTRGSSTEERSWR